MSQDYVLNQKCPACGSRQESTLKAIKSQRVFECNCCGLVVALRPADEIEIKSSAKKTEEAIAV
ncbi:MAG: transposase [Pseudomonadales bacterium]|nr:transposase [Pseudomonadales bacterium]